MPSFEKKISYLFVDIDGTLTETGKIHSDVYTSLWQLSEAGVRIIPVTGRPAGWCDMVARFWPVCAVVGENGAFYFRLLKNEMRRVYWQTDEQRSAHRSKLKDVEEQLAREVPEARISADQFCRIADLAVDYSEDIRALSASQVQRIVQIFEEKGATVKVSNIHVNGWFGQYDKLSMCRRLMVQEFDEDLDDLQEQMAFVGDSPNDAPMFEFFKNSFAVANIQSFLDDLDVLPRYISTYPEGKGFVEIATQLMKNHAQ